MIRRACYVACDLCGDPAETVTDGAEMARRVAALDGWKRVGGRDICPRHIVLTRDEHGHRQWHIDASLVAATSPEAARGGGE